MNVQLINEELLKALRDIAQQNERKRINFDLRTTPEDGSQRMLNVLEPGTHVKIHRHQETSESVICLEGCLDWVFFEEDQGSFRESARFRICPREGQFGIQVPPKTWHSIEVYEPSTLFEAMDGPYKEY
jgi:cupin fold WbuC family metalloprotein